jgi:hypothetical protein
MFLCLSKKKNSKGLFLFFRVLFVSTLFYLLFMSVDLICFFKAMEE